MQKEILTHLGSNKTDYKYDKPDAGLLECFASPFAAEGTGYVEITAPEFTSLCPITGQPDFATIFVAYSPNKKCVESKSFKLYLGSFRQFGEFHESCVARIHADLLHLLEPRSLKVIGKFAPRGGIAFHPSVTWWQPCLP